MKQTLLTILLLTTLVSATPFTRRLTVKEIFSSNDFKPITLSAIKWIPGQDAFTYLLTDSASKKQNIWRCDARTGKSTLFVPHSEIAIMGTARREKRFTLPQYLWAPDGKKMLIPAQNDLFLFDLASRMHTRLTSDAVRERDPRFSPDGRKIAFIKANNLHVLDIASEKSVQLTHDGSEDILIGRFDWVYEEEFSIRTGFQWSPDSRYIAFFRLDQSQEPQFPIVDYDGPHNTVEFMRYPKSGDANALVKIGVVDVTSGRTVWMDRTAGPNDYISRITWTPDSRQVVLTYLNRDQNHLALLFADVRTGRVRTVLTEDVSDGWLEPTRTPHFVPKKNLFVWLSERDGRNHLYLYDMNGHLVRQLTSGPWDVTNILEVTRSGRIYFQAIRDRRYPGHLYTIKLNGKGLKRLTRFNGTHSISLAPSANYYIDTFSSFRHPPAQVLYASGGKKIATLSPGYVRALRTIDPPDIEFFRFPTSRGDSLDAFLIKPVDFDPYRRYPVLIYTYAGPGSHLVYDHWFGRRMFWYKLLTAKGYLIFCVDGHGTAYRGRAFKHSVYRHLGDVEIRDQIEGAKYLKMLPFVDSNRIGIWGWSYGGYTTLMSILKGAEHFRMGVAVAPVTDWRNYDTIYTERYMDQPADNDAGYREASAMSYAQNLRGRLLIIHGTSDDNVHIANTMQLVKALEEHEKQFDLMVYPGKRHGIGGIQSQVHLYEKMTEFILRNL